MKFNVVVLLLFAAIRLNAQGLVFNDQAYKSLPIHTIGEDGAKGEATLLKNNFKVDLKPYCPTVREQGKISSCVGWSVGYAAMTIENAVANKWANDQETIDNNAFSAMFVYNQIKLGDCFFGAELNDAFAVLKEKGNVFYRDFAVQHNCDSLPVETLMEKARFNRLRDFSVLFSPDDKADVKIDRVKRTLARQKPVVIGMVLPENFLALKSNEEVWYPDVGKTDLFGGHAMVVVGYDDGRKAFEIMNSWGKAWANQGFVWVRYRDFAEYCKYAYQLVLGKEDINYLQGNIQVLKPVLKSLSDGSVVFSPIAFINNRNQYELSGENINLPLEFQLVAEGFREESYLYVISFDQDLKAAVHWPRDEKLNRQFVDETESARMTERHSRITLPGKYRVFTLSEPGTEYLCVLNSNNQIKNVVECLRQMRTMKGDLSARIQKAFNTKPPGDYSSSFADDRITFYARGAKSEVVSILLQFQVER